MTDSCKTAVLAAVAGGYLLGRTRKAKLALTLGSVVAGRKLGLDPQELLRAGVRKIAATPQFEELTDQVKHQLMAAARTAVSSAANRRLESLADSLRDRTTRLGEGGEGGSPDDGDGEEGKNREGGEDREDREGPEAGRREEGEQDEGERGEGERKAPSGADSSADRRSRKPPSDRPRSTSQSDRPKKKPSSGGTGGRPSADGTRRKPAERSGAAGGRRHG
ncbi:hypothetical protein [Streptomyces sp. 3N207]|uniref:hypothetical protein n=1 Tax=Streptomyces sp. 3N207 TaxID=3457417 RepID=UPI003FD3762A